MAAGAVEDDALRLLGQLAPRDVEVEVVGAGEAGQHLHVIRRGRLRLGPGHDRALGDREVVVGDDEVLVEDQFLAEPVAGRAGALRRVEQNSRGSISAMVKPETGQANFSEKTMRPAAP